MDEDLCQTLSRACDDCHLAGGCCFEARPPLSQKRIDMLMENGVSADAIEFVGYKRLRLRQDGFCVLFRDGKCSIHDIKPETCVAGPFTFDIEDDMLQIFLKRESICPMVRFLRANRKAYDALFETSVEKIMDLIRSVPEEEMAQILQIDEPQTDLVAEIRLED
jgi:hypothetical protein